MTRNKDDGAVKLLSSVSSKVALNLNLNRLSEPAGSATIANQSQGRRLSVKAEPSQSFYPSREPSAHGGQQTKKRKRSDKDNDHHDHTAPGVMSTNGYGHPEERQRSEAAASIMTAIHYGVTDTLSDGTENSVITLKNLQLQYGVIAPDIWGKPQEQPASVTVNLVLRHNFASAASNDELDQSTIHYENLALGIRATLKPNQTPGAVSGNIERILTKMAMKPDGKFILSRSSKEFSLPRASMYGDGVALANIMTYDENGKWTAVQNIFKLRDVRIMTLIGVYGYERSAKQPVVVNVELSFETLESNEAGPSKTVALYGLEQALVEIFQDSRFGTLESLAEHAVQKLQEKMLNQMFPGSYFTLRVEKPRAISFVDAPCIKVSRRVPGSRPSHRTPEAALRRASTTPSEPDALTVIKPYA